MKNSIFLLFAFFMAFSVNSCSTDDDSSSSSDDKIVGTWKLSGQMINGNFEPDVSDQCDEELIKFLANNTAEVIDKYCEEGGGQDVTPFTWANTDASPFNYVFIDNDTGNENPEIIIFSSNFNKFTVYNTEQDMIDENFGTVYVKQ